MSGIMLDALTTKGSKYISIVPVFENSMVKNINILEIFTS